MFGINQNDLVTNLNLHQKKICQYGGHTHCDCKYGASHTGEQCGCPEVRMASELIAMLTPKQFKSACKKAKITIL